MATRKTLALEWEDTSDDEAPADWLPLAVDMVKTLHENKPIPPLFYRLTSLLKTFNYNQLNDMFIKMSPDLWATAKMAIGKLGSEPSMKLLLDLMKYGSMSSSEVHEITKYLLKNYEISSAMIDIIEVPNIYFKYMPSVLCMKFKILILNGDQNNGSNNLFHNYNVFYITFFIKMCI